MALKPVQRQWEFSEPNSLLFAGLNASFELCYATSTGFRNLWAEFLARHQQSIAQLPEFLSYDNLISVISDGATDLPAAGFAIGDVTLSNLLRELTHTKVRIDEALKARLSAFIIVADENRRPDAIRLASSLRQLGIAVDYWSQPAKVGRQFQQAEALGSVYAVVVGPEWPQVRVKQLAGRREEMISKDELPALLRNK